MHKMHSVLSSVHDTNVHREGIIRKPQEYVRMPEASKKSMTSRTRQFIEEAASFGSCWTCLSVSILAEELYRSQ